MERVFIPCPKCGDPVITLYPGAFKYADKIRTRCDNCRLRLIYHTEFDYFEIMPLEIKRTPHGVVF